MRCLSGNNGITFGYQTGFSVFHLYTILYQVTALLGRGDFQQLPCVIRTALELTRTHCRE